MHISQHIRIVTYRIVEQRRLRRVCANAQTRQSLRCSLTQSLDADEDLDQSLDRWPRMGIQRRLLHTCDKYQTFVNWLNYYFDADAHMQF